MKNFIYNILIWLSGSDNDILDKSPKSEQIKHALYGVLVLVPATLALFAMTYAISTFTGFWYIYVPAGVVWSIIVLFFDRFIVSTFRKSKSVIKDIFSFVFISRFIFATFIGITVGHPLVLLHFQNSIIKKLNDNKNKEESTISNEYDKRISELRNEINKKEELRDCLNKLLTYELNGIQITTPCGATSDKSGDGGKAKELRIQINKINAEIVNLSNRNKPLIQQINNGKQEKIKTSNDVFAYDYTARDHALTQMENEHNSPVKRDKWFIILFFVFVDILPVAWKAATKRGQYDEYLETEEYRVEIEQNAERAALKRLYDTSMIDNKIFEAEAVLRAKRLDNLTKSAIIFIENIEKNRLKASRIFENINKKILDIKDADMKNRHAEYLIMLRQLYVLTTSKAIARFNSFINSL